MRRVVMIGIAAAFAAGSAARAPAQTPAPAAPATAGGLFSSNGPIDATADGAERYAEEGRTVYIGNVDVVQGQARLRTPRLTLYSAKRAKGSAPSPQGPGGDFGNIERIEAEGPVYYVTPTQQVKGDHGTYIAADDTITVTGNVTLLQGQDVMHGDKLVMEQKTGVSHLSTSSPGKGPQRVRSVFFPKAATPAAGTAPAPGAPTTTAPKPGA